MSSCSGDRAPATGQKTPRHSALAALSLPRPENTGPSFKEAMWQQAETGQAGAEPVHQRKELLPEVTGLAWKENKSARVKLDSGFATDWGCDIRIPRRPARGKIRAQARDEGGNALLRATCRAARWGSRSTGLRASRSSHGAGGSFFSVPYNC